MISAKLHPVVPSRQCRNDGTLGPDFLPQFVLKEGGHREGDMVWKRVVFLAKGEEEPSVLENIEDRTEVPERWNDEGHLLRDAAEFLEESGGIFDVLDRVRAESVLELVGGEGEMVDVIHDDKVINIGVFDDIDVDATTVRLAATDIEIPRFATVSNDPAHDSIAQKI